MKNRFFMAFVGFFIATIGWLLVAWGNSSNIGSISAICLAVLSIISTISIYVRYKKTK